MSVPPPSTAPITYTTPVEISAPPRLISAAVANLAPKSAESKPSVVAEPTTPAVALQKGHVMIQNIETEMNEANANELLSVFGNVEKLEWPTNEEGKPGGMYGSGFISFVILRGGN